MIREEREHKIALLSTGIQVFPITATFLDVFLKDSSKHALRLYTKLADLEQGEKETPGKFLDRLWEALCKFPDVDPESAEGEMILKDTFVTQLAPDTWCTLQKQEF